jgi:hypothetical protein
MLPVVTVNLPVAGSYSSALVPPKTHETTPKPISNRIDLRINPA